MKSLSLWLQSLLMVYLSVDTQDQPMVIDVEAEPDVSQKEVPAPDPQKTA